MSIFAILAMLAKEGPAMFAAVQKIRSMMSETDRDEFDRILAEGDEDVRAAAERLKNS